MIMMQAWNCYKFANCTGKHTFMSHFYFITILQVFFACYWVSFPAIIPTEMTSLGNICSFAIWDSHFNAFYTDFIDSLCIAIRPRCHSFKLKTLSFMSFYVRWYPELFLLFWGFVLFHVCGFVFFSFWGGVFCFVVRNTTVSSQLIFPYLVRISMVFTLLIYCRKVFVTVLPCSVCWVEQVSWLLQSSFTRTGVKTHV